MHGAFQATPSGGAGEARGDFAGLVEPRRAEALPVITAPGSAGSAPGRLLRSNHTWISTSPDGDRPSPRDACSGSEGGDSRADRDAHQRRAGDGAAARGTRDPAGRAWGGDAALPRARPPVAAPARGGAADRGGQEGSWVWPKARRVYHHGGSSRRSGAYTEGWFERAEAERGSGLRAPVSGARCGSPQRADAAASREA